MLLKIFRPVHLEFKINALPSKSFYYAPSGLGFCGISFPGFHPGLSYFVLSGLFKDFYYNLFLCFNCLSAQVEIFLLFLAASYLKLILLLLNKESMKGIPRVVPREILNLFYVKKFYFKMKFRIRGNNISCTSCSIS